MLPGDDSFGSQVMVKAVGVAQAIEQKRKVESLMPTACGVDPVDLGAAETTDTFSKKSRTEI